MFQGRITNREANKRINELKQSAKLFREKHKKDLEQKQDQSKYSDLEQYDDDRE